MALLFSALYYEVGSFRKAFMRSMFCYAEIGLNVKSSSSTWHKST